MPGSVCFLMLKKIPPLHDWCHDWPQNFPWFSTGRLLPNLQALLPLLRHQRRLRCTVHRRCVITGSGHGHQPSAWHQTSMEKHLAALQFIGPQQKHISRNKSTISKKKPKNPKTFSILIKQPKQPPSAVSKSPSLKKGTFWEAPGTQMVWLQKVQCQCPQHLVFYELLYCFMV